MAKVAEEFELANHLSKEIKKAVRENRLEQTKAQLEELQDQKYKWSGLRNLRAKPRLKFTKFKDKDGNRIPSTQHPQEAA